jgi:hypothetical protein
MLKTGYNLVRADAIRAFHDDVEHRYGFDTPFTLSVVRLLRHIQRRAPLPHKVVQITGFPALWAVTPGAEHDPLAQMLYWTFYRRMNWLQNENYYLYFVVPETVTFIDAKHLYLRISSDLYADMTDVFGHLTQESSEHYHHNFSVSQV